MRMPDTLFEVSWEVCNKVGGIHTVISSKAPSMVAALGDDYVTVGPWLLPQSGKRMPFVEESGHEAFVEACRAASVPARVGRWAIPGSPRCIQVAFSELNEAKDGILAGLWERHDVDSLRGGWDYIEPVLFGHAAGIAIQLWWQLQAAGAGRQAVAQFHEWLTGAGLLYLHDHCPEIGQVFTTHATVVGRAVTASGRRLSDALVEQSPAVLAQALGVPAKHSLERAAARRADAFTTVSAITAAEAEPLFGRRPDPLTPNGIDPNVIAELAGGSSRVQARSRLQDLLERYLGCRLDGALLVASSGRYEFHNKGYDLLIHAAAQIDARPGRPMVLVFLVPAGHSGLRPDLAARLQGEAPLEAGPLPGLATHVLHDPDGDPIARRCRELGLDNAGRARVKVVHLPIYLEVGDGLFDLPYEALLQGFDLSCFPSAYEPWGYTPQESLALGLPTLTSDQAGFGRWCQAAGLGEADGLFLLLREGHDDAEAGIALAEILERLGRQPEALAELAPACRRAAAGTDWSLLLPHYAAAYAAALDLAAERALARAPRTRPTVTLPVRPNEAAGRPSLTRFDLSAELPPALSGLEALARNLWWSWDPEAESLFASIAARRWEDCAHNPVRLLRQLSPAELQVWAEDPDFKARLDRVTARLDACLRAPDADWGEGGPDAERPVAYFCAEFGIHGSLPIYSGGLGVLAGDGLKAASDLRLPLLAVGLFYRGGYLSQAVTAAGDQVPRPLDLDPRDLPMDAVLDPEGRPLEIGLELPGMRLLLRAWRVMVGRIPLYLLDSDLAANSPAARAVTRQLYGGDQEMRLRQEIVLGKGGARLLERLGIRPAVYHLNEGHAALVGLERISQLVHGAGLRFDTAWAVARAGTLFTTHTPVPAGHDRFPEDLVRRHFANAADWLGVPWERFYALGQGAGAADRFNMSALAFRSAGMTNAVSALHREVSQGLLHDFSPALLENEVPVFGVTNGVHLATWTAPEIAGLLGVRHRSTRGEDFRSRSESLDPESLWAVRRLLRERLLRGLARRLEASFVERHDSPSMLHRMLDGLDPTALVIGFARRFAPYKRADLLLREPERLAALLAHPTRPVRLVVAGKAHPNDRQGQALLRELVEAARRPELIGRLFFVEDHDIALARLLVQGADVWLNTPIHRLEASGTSGMKAAANGGLNLSILDGWWAEGHDGANGWAIGGARLYGPEDQPLQDELDCAELFRLLEEDVVPEFYARDAADLPQAWLRRVRHSLASIPPRFSAERMVGEYAERAYLPLAREQRRLSEADFAAAAEQARRDARLRDAFGRVAIRGLRIAELDGLHAGDAIPVRATLQLGELAPEDLVVELLLGRPDGPQRLAEQRRVELQPVGPVLGGECSFEARPVLDQVGRFAYGLRVRARDLGSGGLDDLMIWA
ncbi:MAG: alpha-glucan family phosphorylase [Chloroflexi bacterium]|nr:alpha-glucan family phosphorylase [Chloroflexota bacterium]